MTYYFNPALDNGLKPSEISETITRLAFYSGWANAMSAVVVAKDVFSKRGIGASGNQHLFDRRASRVVDLPGLLIVRLAHPLFQFTPALDQRRHHRCHCKGGVVKAGRLA
jgi:hypothetical protein